MSIEIIKENFQVEEMKGSGEVQALVETEVYLNTNKPDIENIIWVDGRIDIVNTKVIQDKLLIDGIIKFSLAYKSIDEEEYINTLETSKDFKEEIYIEGINENMIPNVDGSIDYIEQDIDNTKIELRALIDLFGEVREERTIEIIQDIEDEENLQTLEENIKYNEIYGRETTYANIEDTIKVDNLKPAIDKIIRFSVEVKETESTVVDGRIIISGEAMVSIIYLGDEKINSLKEAIPFNHFIEIPAAYKDSQKEVKLEVAEAIYEVQEDDMEDLKIIDLDIRIKVSGKVFDEVSRNLIIDAYSTKEGLDLKTEEINIKEHIKSLDHEESLAFDLDLDAIEVLDIQERNNIIDKKYLDQGISIDGVVTIDVYYIDRTSGELKHYNNHFSYKSSVPYDEESRNLNININHKLGDMKYILKKDTMSIENTINYNILLSKDKKIPGIIDIEETGEEIDTKDAASITIYIVQEEDILWDIAKRYNTTIEEILQSNNLDEDYEIEVGDKIIIEKKVDLEF
ncbi:MAG TPA: SPOCS domain-containing protein [Tissierellaceae bacterium]|nr:SPOCS domain-containing protein [Tissierellaceae bacterium]